MLDTLPEDIIQHILTFCMPVDWREVKCVNKQLHTIYTNLNLVTPIQSIAAIKKHIKDDNIKMYGIPTQIALIAIVRYINVTIYRSHTSCVDYSVLLDILIHNTDNATTQHGQNVRDVFIIHLIATYINKECKSEQVLNSYTLTKYISLFSQYPDYSTFLLERAATIYSGNYFKTLVKHLPEDIKLVSTMLLVNYHPITVYHSSKIGRYYYNNPANIQEDIQYMCPDSISSVTQTAESLSYINSKCTHDAYNTQILIRALIKQKQKNTKEIYTQILTKASNTPDIAVINTRLNSLFKDREKDPTHETDLFYYKSYIHI